MANVYRTAKGKMVDIDKVKLMNEETIAVGNMRVNARGDALGVGSNVVAGRNQIMDQVYAVPESGYSLDEPANYAQRQAVMEASNAKQLAELVDNLTVPITPTTTADAPAPAARGNLADSIAKTTTVTQEPLPTPKEQAKSNGPTRI